ncbi:MAG: ABC transporter permease [Bacillota bacterium]
MNNLVNMLFDKLGKGYINILTTLLSIFLGLFVSGLLMLLLGHDPIESYMLIIEFAFLDSYNIANIFTKAAPLILTALAFGFAFQAKLFNIGGQGQFYIGTMAAVFVALFMENVPMLLALLLPLLASIVAGGAWASLIGYFKARFNANEFLISMMSTYVAIAIMDYLLRVPLQEAKGEYPQTDVIPQVAQMPKLIANTPLHYGFLISLAAALIAYIILWHTRLGFHIRAVGQNRDAARFAGIDQKKIFVIVFMICGIFAGLAGFMQVTGVQYRAIQGFQPNIGAAGIGVAILGHANPFGIVIASILFSTIEVGGLMLTQTSTLPSSIIYVMQGLVVIFVVISYFVRSKILTAKQKRELARGEEA